MDSLSRRQGLSEVMLRLLDYSFIFQFLTMEKDQSTDLPLSPEEFREMSSTLEKNKKKMIDILQSCPKVGVYNNQTLQDWDNFFQFYMNFLRSQIGPRGQCAKAIRAQLLKRQHQIDEILQPFGQTSRTHIREIFMKHKFHIPCPEYTKYLKLKDVNDKYKQNYSRLKDKNSPMRKSIYDGLLKKHGEEYDFDSEFIALGNAYSGKIAEAEKELSVLREFLDTSKEYQQFMRVKTIFQPYFRQWSDADSNMGKENLKTGAQFQEKVNNTMIPYLISREKSDPQWPYASKKFQVFTNASWIPKNLGEIDIAFGYKDQTQDRYFVFTLIQCKSRLFDLRQAFKQVSLDDQEPLNKGPNMQQLKDMKRLRQQMNNAKSKKKSKKRSETDKKIEKEEEHIQNEDIVQPNKEEIQIAKEKDEQIIDQPTQIEYTPPAVTKKFLSTKYGPAELVPNHHFYVITTLPQNSFQLPIESKMKQGIEKFTKNMFIQDIQSQPLYLQLLQRFSQVSSPLDWLQKYEQDLQRESNILVLD